MNNNLDHTCKQWLIDDQYKFGVSIEEIFTVED